MNSTVVVHRLPKETGPTLQCAQLMVPRSLLSCSMCKQLLVDPVRLPCCSETVCRACIPKKCGANQDLRCTLCARYLAVENVEQNIIAEENLRRASLHTQNTVKTQCDSSIKVFPSKNEGSFFCDPPNRPMGFIGVKPTHFRIPKPGDAVPLFRKRSFAQRAFLFPGPCPNKRRRVV